MHPIVRNILAVVAGLVLGSIVNMGLIMTGHSVVPPPPGTDMTTPEGLKAAMPLMEAKHFIFPFLAHALGTFVGAYIAARIAATHKMKFALAIGVLFLIGGIMNVVMLSAPMWFNVLDLVVAYLPMAWLAGRLGLN